jgi:hypothetical protein
VLDDAGLAPGAVADLLAATRADLERELATLTAEIADGVAPIPEVEADVLAAGGDLAATRDAIRRRGCVVVRGTFEHGQAEAWDRELGDYLDRNRFDDLVAERAPEAAAGGSRIWGIYWSRPQVEARQHDRMAAVRAFLNSVWRHERDGTRWFDPDEDIGYPDRVRRRPPGTPAKGLRPHVDSPSAAGWRIDENRLVFAEVLAGRPERHDPWDAAHRTGPLDGAPVASSVFRTFQGWTALTGVDPADGGLQLLPVPRAISFLLVEAIAAELGTLDEQETEAGAAAAGRPARLGDHPLLRPALVPIPPVAPGDTVWWHGDLVHAVAPAANQHRWNDVMYIAAAPRCPRNDVYSPTMLDRFVRGESPVDFPAEHLEVDFVGRATVDDLDARGRRHFGLEPSPVT